MRRSTRMLALFWLAVTTAGCTSRTLPLPPPELEPMAGPNAAGVVFLRGTAQEGASVGVMNDSTLTGVIVTSEEEGCARTCPFEAELPAEPGDVIRVWQFYETKASLQVVVPDEAP